MKQKILERIGYSEHIERMFGRGMMLALTGQRRVGKSCVMHRILDHIAENKTTTQGKNTSKKTQVLSSANESTCVGC